MANVVKANFSNNKINSNEATYKYTEKPVKAELSNNNATYDMPDYTYGGEAQTNQDLFTTGSTVSIFDTPSNVTVGDAYTGNIYDPTTRERWKKMKESWKDVPNIKIPTDIGIGIDPYAKRLEPSGNIPDIDIPKHMPIGIGIGPYSNEIEPIDRLGQKVGAFIVSSVTSIAKQIEKITDSLVTSGASVASNVLSLLGKEELGQEVADKASEYVKRNMVGEAQDFYFDALGIDEDIRNGKVVQAGNMIGEAAGTIGLITLGGAAGAAAKGVTGGIVAATTAGGASEKALNNGASLDKAAATGVVAGAIGFAGGQALGSLGSAARTTTETVGQVVGNVVKGTVVGAAAPALTSGVEYVSYGKDMVGEDGQTYQAGSGFKGYYTEQGGVESTVMGGIVGGVSTGIQSGIGYKANNNPSTGGTTQTPQPSPDDGELSMEELEKVKGNLTPEEIEELREQGLFRSPKTPAESTQTAKPSSQTTRELTPEELEKVKVNLTPEEIEELREQGLFRSPKIPAESTQSTTPSTSGSSQGAPSASTTGELSEAELEGIRGGIPYREQPEIPSAKPQGTQTPSTGGSSQGVPSASTTGELSEAELEGIRGGIPYREQPEIPSAKPQGTPSASTTGELSEAELEGIKGGIPYREQPEIPSAKPQGTQTPSTSGGSQGTPSPSATGELTEAELEQVMSYPIDNTRWEDPSIVKEIEYFKKLTDPFRTKF